MALSLNDRKRRAHFLAFAGHCGIGADEAETTIDRLRGQLAVANKTTDRSMLPPSFRLAYKRELAKKDKALEG